MFTFEYKSIKILFFLFFILCCWVNILSAQTSTKSIRYGDVVYEFTEVKSKDGFVTDTKVKIINQSDGKVLYENMMDEIKKDEEKTEFQYLQDYRLIDLNGDGSDELILSGYVGMSPYFLFGNGYIIDKTKSYLPVYEIQNLDLQRIDSVNKVLVIVEKESPAVLGLWNTYYAKYNNGKLELIPYLSEEFESMLTDERYNEIKEISKEFEADVCEVTPLNKDYDEIASYYWYATYNIIYNAVINNVFNLAAEWFLRHNDCKDKDKILEVLMKGAEERYNEWKKNIDEYYRIKYR